MNYRFLWAAMPLCIVMAIAGGCQSYGGRLRTVTINSVPDGATAYVIPHQYWVEHGGAALLNDWSKLEDYRVKAGTTPVDVTLPPHEHVVVVRKGDKYQYDNFVPNRAQPSVMIAIPQQ